MTRPVTAADLAAFLSSKAAFLAVDSGALIHLDEESFFAAERPPVAYDWARTDEGREVLILCERRTLLQTGPGAWFPDLIDTSGHINEDVLAEAAALITSDGLLPYAIRAAALAIERWGKAAAAADAAALDRARTVAAVVDLVGGSQAEAGRLLGLDPSRVNRLTTKAKGAK